MKIGLKKKINSQFIRINRNRLGKIGSNIQYKILRIEK